MRLDLDRHRTLGELFGQTFGTLLFFDSRARSSLPWQGPPPGDWIAPEPPERPVLPPRI